MNSKVNTKHPTKHKGLLPWLALFGGAWGVHRFYLFGVKDVLAWLHVALALPGTLGLARLRNLGMDDKLGTLLVPLLGLAIAAGCLGGLVYTLMNDERFNARFNAGQAITKMNWAAVLGAIACLMLMGIATMATLAYSFQKLLEN